ncbi:MAG: hypothetical protein R3B57_04575 [Phycisphaerales bacterium]
MTRSRIAGGVGATAILLVSAAVAGDCWMASPLIFDSCSLAECDTSMACTNPVEQTEDVHMAFGGADEGKTAKADVLYNCYVIWFEFAPVGGCIEPHDCNLVVPGQIPSGFHCPRGGPIS